MRKTEKERGLFQTELLRCRSIIGISQEALSKELKLSKYTVFKWENKRAIPSLRAWKKLISFFESNNVDTNYLQRLYEQELTTPIKENNNK